MPRWPICSRQSRPKPSFRSDVMDDAAADTASKPGEPVVVASAPSEGYRPRAPLDLVTRDFGQTWTVDHGESI